MRSSWVILLQATWLVEVRMQWGNTGCSWVRLIWCYTVFSSKIEMRLHSFLEWDWDEVIQGFWVRLRLGYSVLEWDWDEVTQCYWVRLRLGYTECSWVRLRWGKTECSWVRLLWGSTECSWAFLWIMRLQWGVTECSGVYIYGYQRWFLSYLLSVSLQESWPVPAGSVELLEC